MGLLLQTAADSAPEGGGAFLVLDRSLSVCAVSRGAERLLATRETDAVNHHVTELLVPADSETQASLATAVADATTTGNGGPHSVIVRPANQYGVRLRSRIVPCGPPPAALLLFDGPRS
jgi:hypothetical protein